MGVGSRIDDICKKKNISLRKLSMAADVPYSTLYSAVKRDSSGIDVETLRKVANVLDVAWYELISENRNEQVNVISTQYSKERLEKIIKDYGKLSDDGQQVAVERVHELTEIPRYKRKSTPEE